MANSYPGYYATAFPKYQQKDISGFLTNIWQLDPFKAKWSILAKSYSVIRDSQGKDNAPLDQFLAITGPLIGVIKPELYLQAMGWEIATQEHGQTVMNRYVVDLDESLFITNLSVNDLIRHCYHLGFFTGNLAEVLSSENEVVMTMAISVQHAATNPLATYGQNQGYGTQSADNADADGRRDESYNGNGHDTAAEPSGDGDHDNNDSEAAKDTPQKSNSHNVPPSHAAGAGQNPVSSVTNSNTGPTSNVDQNEPGTLQTINETTDVTQQPNTAYAAVNPASGLSAANFHLTSSYPYNAEFDPNLPSFVFDPFLGNHFDAFDISDLSWEDSIDFDAPS